MKNYLNRYTRLLDDSVLVSACTAGTAFLVELSYRGFVSAYIDLNILIVLAFILLAVRLTLSSEISEPLMDTFALRYAGVFLAVQGVLIWHVLALQRGGSLLGLGLTFALFSVLILLTISMYDRWRRN